MEELLLAVAKGLVEDKDAVKVTVDEANEDGIIVYHLTVAEDDMGRGEIAVPCDLQSAIAWMNSHTRVRAVLLSE